tara:strand:- start:92 stop:328 length:237 start_codon:yes stop_codon:yes gene_type:complete
MAKGIHDFTAQESVAPYIKAVVSTQATMDACRAVYIGVGAAHTLTINGVDVDFTGMIPGTIYPISCTKSNLTTVIFLY